MKIFHYHPETGIYLGEGQADPSPLETDVWLIPAYATAEEPPNFSNGEGVVWVNGAWQVYLIPVPEPEPEPLTPDPIPEPEPLTPEQKLQKAELTVEELKSLLGL